MNAQENSIRNQVRQCVPFLRRFGRAALGRQDQADQCVLQIMHDVLTDHAIMSTASTPRSALYRRMAATLGSSSYGYPTLQSRQSYWLSAVEGFAEDEVAEIIDVAPSEVKYLNAVARRENDMRMGSDILIIEDELFIAKDLKNIVMGMGHNVCGIARTHKEAIIRHNRHAPDLVLSDVQLADGSSGIEAIQEIERTHPIPHIFITAFPERFLTGNGAEPIFMVSKPFRREEIKATISQALFIHACPLRARPESS